MFVFWWELTRRRKCGLCSWTWLRRSHCRTWGVWVSSGCRLEADLKRVLPELEAYAALVTALRAQGTLSAEKVKVLKETCALLNINQDRHKAEVRRVVNDEKLNTIAYQWVFNQLSSLEVSSGRMSVRFSLLGWLWSSVCDLELKYFWLEIWFRLLVDFDNTKSIRIPERISY